MIHGIFHLIIIVPRSCRVPNLLWALAFMNIHRSFIHYECSLDV